MATLVSESAPPTGLAERNDHAPLTAPQAGSAAAAGGDSAIGPPPPVYAEPLARRRGRDTSRMTVYVRRDGLFDLLMIAVAGGYPPATISPIIAFGSAMATFHAGTAQVARPTTLSPLIG